MTAQTHMQHFPDPGRSLPPAAPVAARGQAAEPQRVKVAHVMLSLDVGGLERNVMNQLRHAPRLNQQVTIVCLERPGALARQVEELGGIVIDMKKRPGLRWELFGELRAVLKGIGPHVVHTHQLATLLYGGRAARMAGVPVVLHTEHGKENYAGRAKTRWLGRWSARYTSRFYCLTQDMASAVRGHGITPERKIFVISNGIDSAPFLTPHDTRFMREQLRIPPTARVVGTVGRLTEIKRQDVLLRAFARLITAVPNAHLLLVGDGELRSELQALADALGIADRVHFAGYHAQTAAHYQMMDVFALTSRSEGTPQAVIEASFSGVPVVASRVGGLPELVEDGRTGLLFASGNHEELAAALQQVLTHPALADQFREAARQRVTARYEIARMADEYHSFYLEELALRNAARAS
jgi:sugar transferase (PEP-CTERM/EpsH1 system associated)